MDFIEQLQQLAKRIPQLCEHLQTEEATSYGSQKLECRMVNAEWGVEVKTER